MSRSIYQDLFPLLVCNMTQSFSTLAVASAFMRDRKASFGQHPSSPSSRGPSSFVDSYPCPSLKGSSAFEASEAFTSNHPFASKGSSSPSFEGSFPSVAFAYLKDLASFPFKAFTSLGVPLACPFEASASVRNHLACPSVESAFAKSHPTYPSTAITFPFDLLLAS